jgi:hypothetical protein
MVDRRTWFEVALLAGAAALTIFAAAFGVWLAAVYGVVMLVPRAVKITGRWRTGDYFNFSARLDLSRAQQTGLGYVLSLPLWAAMCVYQHGHPAVLVGFVLGTLVAGVMMGLEIRRGGWSRRS